MNIINFQNIRYFILFLIVCQIASSVVLGVFLPFEPSVIVPTAEFGELFKKTFDLNFTTEKMPRSYYYFEQFNGAGSDSLEYLKIAAGKESIPPFSLRPAYPKAIGFLASLFYSPVENIRGFINVALLINIFNNFVLILFGSILLFFCLKKISNDDVFSSFSTALFICNIGTLQTSSYFMLDTPSYAIAVLLAWLFLYNRFWTLLLSICLSLFLKEIFIIFTLIPAMLIIKRTDYLKIFSLTFPLIIFISIRVVMGEDPLSVNYGWSLSKGEYKTHYLLWHLSTFHIFLIKIFFSLGSMIIGVFILKKYIKNRLLFMAFVLTMSVVLANLLLASRVSRIVFIVYPILAITLGSGVMRINKLNKKDAI